MVFQYTYPTQQTLEEIEQDLLPVLTQADPIFDHFPLDPSTDTVLRWEQLDNYKGLQAVRGINGEPGKVSRVGAKGYLMAPGVYGEQESLDERELTERRKLGQLTQRADVSDLVRQIQEHLMTREIDRIRFILWTLATTGTFSVSTADGVVAHTDSFPIQTYTASPAWSTSATAAPLLDLRTAKLLARGHSVSFGAKARLYVNQTQANYLLQNANAADLSGKRLNLGSTFNSITDDNRIFLENDLPQVVVYDEGYYDNAGVFQLFLPTGKGVLIGPRPNGRPAGAYRLTFNANANAPGSYMKVIDTAERDVPRQIIVHRGHNGGPILQFPSSVVVMNI